jgi:hypothetical protein
MFDPTTSHWLQEPQPLQPTPAQRYLARWITITCVSCAVIAGICLIIAETM